MTPKIHGIKNRVFLINRVAVAVIAQCFQNCHQWCGPFVLDISSAELLVFDPDQLLVFESDQLLVLEPDQLFVFDPDEVLVFESDQLFVPPLLPFMPPEPDEPSPPVWANNQVDKPQRMVRATILVFIYFLFVALRVLFSNENAIRELKN
jgi:hypothetical protein